MTSFREWDSEVGGVLVVLIDVLNACHRSCTERHPTSLGAHADQLRAASRDVDAWLASHVGPSPDLTVQLAKSTTAQDINAAFDEAAGGELRGILAVSHEELVSSDFKGNPHSSIVDAPLTLMLGGDWAKVVSWYDNEWGFSCRMIDLIAYMADKL